ncbi:hypothetical protein PHYPSEUDO_006645 [Phytophthora pseudosyringae]|uniref:K Homology domain-containing protein n=1 Tax=Phytophthora pseudosyringae TaxID=221518 RepID=A0A8T1WFN1_9STRA|nr:hypothetical protein PHYPSEUDO_006645 [Phytophthora pseudosyringae]
MQQLAAASSADAADADRKAKLLALLDRARVNRGLQPEHSGDAPVAMDAQPPPIKTEHCTNIKNAQSSTPRSQEQQAPQCTCGHSHQSASALQAPERKRRGSNGSPNINSEPSGAIFTPIQTPGDNEKDVAMHAELSVAAPSSTPKPRFADLTGGSRQKTPRLQQLKPLDEPRKHTHQPQPEPHEEKPHAVKRELPRRAQPKQHRKNAPCTNTSVTLKGLELLTPDEYEDSELHGDFQHMLHILIPSNATTSLLERRGQPIQSISQQADCTLSIREPEASPFKDDRLLRIYGKAKGISLAQRLVIAYIRAYRAEKGDPNYVDLSEETPPVALPATSITKAMSVAVSSGKKHELEITSPFNWMVQRDDVGKMMGRQGSILATIRRDTGASIHLDVDVAPGTTERRVILGGSVDSIAAAIEEIKSRSGGRPEVSASAASGRLGQYFAIPYHAAGYLIGPQGSTVKSITERTGARLQIPSAEDLPLGSINRILHMQGTPKQAEHARRVVGAKLRDYLAAPKCSRTLSPASTGRKGDKVTIKVLLPSRICGFMLDQRGKLIREISDKSGAYTYFLAPHDDENRVCVFTGDMSSVLRAQRLVLQVIAGDAISSKRVAPPRKRKRSQREEEVVEYVAVAEGDEYMEEEEPYYEGHVEEDYYDDEYEEASRQPTRRHTVRRQPPPRRPQHGYEEHEDHYEGMDEEVEYEERPRQPIRRRPVATRPREYIEDEYAHDDYDHDEYYAPRARPSKRPAVVRRQPLTRRQDEYSQDDDDEYAYATSGSDDDYEQSLVARMQVVKRRAIGSRLDNRRPPVVFPGRKVQMVAPRSSPSESRPRTSPTDRRRANGSGSVRPSSRGGSMNARHSVPRGGRGNGRPSASRGRGNPSKRRRQ